MSQCSIDMSGTNTINLSPRPSLIPLVEVHVPIIADLNYSTPPPDRPGELSVSDFEPILGTKEQDTRLLPEQDVCAYESESCFRKIFDSKDEGWEGGGTLHVGPHCSFHLDGSEGEDVRESIEVRVVMCF